MQNQSTQRWQPGNVVLDLYQVKGLLGAGGFGEVYQVHHPDWNIDLAMKVPRPDKFKKIEDVEAFENEAETWVNLGLHPHTVSCYYVRRDQSSPLVFVEYVSGGSLADWIENRKLYEGGPEVALKRILDIAIQFAWGLHYAHEQGLIHQDVKPQNVMMTENGVVKVTDFGLARATAIAKSSETDDPTVTLVTEAGAMTPAYCSPEQASGQNLTRRTDLWSWAVSVLHMFAGDLLWGYGLAASAHVSSDLPNQQKDAALPRMPKVLVELLERCFQERADDRPHNLKVVADELVEMYRSVVREEYSRLEPTAADLLADDLNNRAISLLDLGKQEEARKKFEQAFKGDPYNLTAAYNRGLILWRCGKLMDLEVVKQIEEFPAPPEEEWRQKWMLGEIHLERGDLEAARKALDESKQAKPDSREVKAAFAALKKLEDEGIGKVERFECDTIDPNIESKVTAVAFSPDDRYVAIGTSQGVVQLWDWKAGKCYKKLSFGKKEVTILSRSVLTTPIGEKTRFIQTKFDPNQEPDKPDIPVTCLAFSPDSNHIAVGMGTQVRLLMNVHSTTKTKKGDWGKFKTLAELEELANPHHLIFVDLSESLDDKTRKTLFAKEIERREKNVDELLTTLSRTGKLPEPKKSTEKSSAGNISSLAFTYDGHHLITTDCPKLNHFTFINLKIGRLSYGMDDYDHPLTASLDTNPAKDEFLFTKRYAIGNETIVMSINKDKTTSHRRKIICTPSREAERFSTSSAVFISKNELISGGIDGVMRVWDLESGGCKKEIIIGKGISLETQDMSGGYRIFAICINHQKNTIFSISDRMGSSFWFVQSWCLKTGQCIRTYFIKRQDDSNDLSRMLCDKQYFFYRNMVSLSSNGIISFGSSNKLCLRKDFSLSYQATLEVIAPGENQEIFENEAKANQLSKAARQYLTSGKVDQALLTLGKIEKIPGREKHPKTRILKREIGLYCYPQKLKSYWKSRFLVGHTQKITALDVSFDSQWVLSGSWDGDARLWNLETGECISKFGMHNTCIRTVSISPNGKFAVTTALEDV